jgi:hypothetical protein
MARLERASRRFFSASSERGAFSTAGLAKRGEFGRANADEAKDRLDTAMPTLATVNFVDKRRPRSNPDMIGAVTLLRPGLTKWPLGPRTLSTPKLFEFATGFQNT